MAKANHYNGRDAVIKCGLLTKRPVVKGKRFGAQSYKNRYFELTHSSLKYFDGDLKNHGKLKGDVPLISMKIVREVEDKRLDDKCNVFQIVYEDKKDFPILYVVAKNDSERQAWLIAISDEAARCGAQFFPKYHPGVWTKKLGYYNCCDQYDRNAIGCKSDHFVQKSPAPPIPPPRPDTATGQRLEYIAMHDFYSTQQGDLELIQGEKYIVTDKSAENWWLAENRDGVKGYIPANFVKINSGLEQYEWYYKECTREQSIQILLQSGKEGCFLVRDSISVRGSYSLSIFTTERGGNVNHYKIRQDEYSKYFVSDAHPFETIPELIFYHKHNAGGLVTRLREPPPRGNVPSTAGFSHGKWQLDESNLESGAELGRGCFGVVYQGTYRVGRNKTPVAIKEMTMAPQSDEFILEFKTMTQLNHPNIVQLYGIIVSDTNPKIVTELLVNGALNDYLKDNRTKLMHDQDKLLYFSMQVCTGMEYLNGRQIIHRDLAARNCLVGAEEVVKVGDFGLAREVLMDNEYQMSEKSKFPTKWSPPEVINYRKYTDKSDVWSYGILLWEIYSLGEMPYQGMKNADVTKYVAIEQRRLSRPMQATTRMYDIMSACWAQNYEDRPSFTAIKRQLDMLGSRENYMPTEPGRF